MATVELSSRMTRDKKKTRTTNVILVVVCSLMLLAAGAVVFLVVLVVRDPNVIFKYPCLVRGSEIKYGDVVDNEGKAIAGVKITFRQRVTRHPIPIPYMPGIRCEHVGTATTDSKGEFQLKEIYPGTEYLSAVHNDFIAPSTPNDDQVRSTRTASSRDQILMQPIDPDERAAEPELVRKFREIGKRLELEVRRVSMNEGDPTYFWFTIFLDDLEKKDKLMEAVTGMAEVQKAECVDKWQEMPRTAFVSIRLKKECLIPGYDCDAARRQPGVREYSKAGVSREFEEVGNLIKNAPQGPTTQPTRREITSKDHGAVPLIPWIPAKRSETSTEVSVDLIRQIVKDRALLESSAEVIPFAQNGKVIGVRLFEIKPQGAWAILGLQHGDVIESINSQPMDNPPRLLTQITRELPTSDITIIVYRRGDERVELTVRKLPNLVSAVRETDGAFSINRSDWLELGKNKGRLESSVQATAFRRNGIVVGIKLLEFDLRGVWGTLGLHPGELLESVNGRALNDASQLFTDVYQAMCSPEPTLLEARRGDLRMRLKITKK